MIEPKLKDVIREIVMSEPIKRFKPEELIERVKEKYPDKWTSETIAREAREMRQKGELSGGGKEGYGIGTSPRQLKIETLLRIRVKGRGEPSPDKTEE